MGFESGISTDVWPTHPACQKCLTKGFSALDGGCKHPRITLRQIRIMTDILVKLGIIKADDTARYCQDRSAPVTCFAHCKCLTRGQRQAFVASATWQRQTRNDPRPKPVVVFLGEKELTPDQKVLNSVLNNGGYAINSDIYD